jgi:hypothetical protein
MRSAIARWAMGWIRKIGEPTTRRKLRNRTRNPKPRRGGSSVSRTGREREKPEPLSGPRQMAARTVYGTPPKTEQRAEPDDHHSRLPVHRCH